MPRTAAAASTQEVKAVVPGDLRNLMREALEKACADGSLEVALQRESEKVAQEQAAATAAEVALAVKQKVRLALEEGQKNGTLEQTLRREMMNATLEQAAAPAPMT